jgi:lysozyme family protein
MTSNFEKCLKFVLEHEGYKSDDKNDPGGRTIFGISHKQYPQDVDAMWTMNYDMAREIASNIYRRDYWDNAGCDTLPWPFDLLAFDTAVNMGLAVAHKLLARSPGGKDFLLRRIELYASYKLFKVYGRGWVNRCIDLYKVIEESK